MARKRKSTPRKAKKQSRRPRKKLVRRRKALKPINFKRELAAGIKVEMEHTKRMHSKKKARKVAERIARDHLEETPYYYRRLKKCFPEEHHNPVRPGLSHMLSPYRIPGRNPRMKHKKGDTYMSSGYAHKVLMTDWRRKIDPRSIRTKTITTKSGGKRLIRIGCPKGEWMARKKRCRVGTKAISIMTPKEEKIVSLARGSAARRRVGNPERRRFFVQQSSEDQKKQHQMMIYLPTCSVLDRERVVGGRYAVIKSGLKYLDALKLADKLNREKGKNPSKQFWMDRSVQTSGLLRKCLASRKDPESQRLQELSGRMESRLKRLRTYDEYMDKRSEDMRKRFGARNPGLTIAQARKQLPPGWVLQKTPEGEYRVGRRGCSESQRYYTDDLQDAVATAHSESRRQSERERSRLAKPSIRRA